MSLLSPDVETLERFNAIIGPMAAMIVQNQNESHVLAAIRDTLLPKLLSEIPLFFQPLRRVVKRICLGNKFLVPLLNKIMKISMPPDYIHDRQVVNYRVLFGWNSGDIQPYVSKLPTADIAAVSSVCRTPLNYRFHL